MSLHSKKGFTLIELMISVAIMAVITTIVVMNQSHYSSDAQLRNAADILALDIRQAQVYGISVGEFSPAPGNFDLGYGIEVNAIGNHNGYIFFGDLDKNGYYTSGDYNCPLGNGSECIKHDLFPSGINAFTMCIIPLNGPPDCSPTRVDISFFRPNPNPNLLFWNRGTPILPGTIKGARITLSTLDANGNINKTKNVVVYTTGQISIE